MSLKSKISLVSGAVILLSVVLNFTVLRTLVYPSFVELERAEAERNMARVLEALNNDLAFLTSINRDWSNWDDTYAYVRSGDESYVEENLYPEALQDVDIPVIYIFDQGGRLVFGTVIDFASGTARQGGDFVFLASVCRERISPPASVLDLFDQRQKLVRLAPHDAGSKTLTRESACDGAARRIAGADDQCGRVKRVLNIGHWDQIASLCTMSCKMRIGRTDIERSRSRPGYSM